MGISVMKVSNDAFVRGVINRAQGMIQKCTTFMDQTLFEDLQQKVQIYYENK